ncbi:hypothetical protein BDY17DRAFT_96514 [Neohortaea acidophila]|uniref:Uncharacterized protein n=1 Tax=Neohortaea acidophila TaxID=245834 RepID=A0A6A6PZ90_9PEZI|nr:uncharacterized protein BDY17DRAFT_96514 [Neohortaea acidophila]KAF2485086.1 hypothetical protein BDY17DRAFT_96514 [Neohortaea acidophila]
MASRSGSTSSTYAYYKPEQLSPQLHQAAFVKGRSSSTGTIHSISSAPASSPVPSFDQQHVTAFPGTMASGGSRSHCQAQPESPQDPQPLRKSSVARRVKSALKDVFASRGIDDTQLEHISQRHWSELDGQSEAGQQQRERGQTFHAVEQNTPPPRVPVERIRHCHWTELAGESEIDS